MTPGPGGANNGPISHLAIQPTKAPRQRDSAMGSHSTALVIVGTVSVGEHD